jgi:hypothetical protein
MKKSTAPIIKAFFISILIFTACESGGDKNITHNLRYATTLTGGCNNQQFPGLKNKSAEEYPDTAWYRLSGDSLIFFAGLNYICCTPFIHAADIRNDSLIMNITDTCSSLDAGCYCRCMCYYTFEFIFTDYAGEHFQYLVSYYDGLDEELINLGDGQL